MPPTSRLRLAAKLMTDPMESLAQSIAERVLDLVIEALDINALIRRVDIDALVEQTDQCTGGPAPVPRPRALAVGQSGRDGWTLGRDHPSRVTRRDGRNATVAAKRQARIGRRRNPRGADHDNKW